MPVPRGTTWPLKPHTRAKHEILRRYLQAWFPILNRYHGKVTYIDGFCGPGRYEGGEPGSPLIALEVTANHRREMSGELRFWFIDERPDRIEHLEYELATYRRPRHFRVHVECGVFHEKISYELQAAENSDMPFGPAFVFVDPFGFRGIPYSLISRLLKQQRCEVLITFAVDAMNRFLEHPRGSVVSHIIEAFGTNESLRIAEGPGNRVQQLRILYQRQLGECARFVRFFEMRDRDDRTLYFLFFASNHRLGHVKMKEAMWKVDPGGDFLFSDATNPDQMVLFEHFVDRELADTLAARFKGQGVVLGRDVRLYVENETAYLNRHKTKALDLLASEGRLVIDKVKEDGSTWTTGYPDKARITFVE